VVGALTVCMFITIPESNFFFRIFSRNICANKKTGVISTGFKNYVKMENVNELKMMLAAVYMKLDGQPVPESVKMEMDKIVLSFAEFGKRKKIKPAKYHFPDVKS
jgi:hypothetical protein